jgi:hypothetical protein
MEEAIPLKRNEFQRAVAAVVARKAGVPLTTAMVVVEKSKVGALQAADLRYLAYKGPDYWAERIIECG